MKDKYHGVYQIQSLNEKEKTCILVHIDNGSERGAHLRHLRKLGNTDLEDPLPIRNEAIRLLNKNKNDKCFIIKSLKILIMQILHNN